MPWLDELDRVTSALEDCASIGQASALAERRARLCEAVPSGLGPAELRRLASIRDRGEAVLVRFRAEAASAREQLSECYRSGQMVRCLPKDLELGPQEYDLMG